MNMYCLTAQTGFYSDVSVVTTCYKYSGLGSCHAWGVFVFIHLFSVTNIPDATVFLLSLLLSPTDYCIMLRQRIDTYQNLLSPNRKLQIYLFVGPERHLQHYDCHC